MCKGTNHGDRIYVEIRIDGPIDTLWERTQTPELHERWDLRFSQIAYLPRPDETQPQKFLYATRIGCGLAIRGGGESVGERTGPDGRRTSALRFWSDDPKSLIREGSGYWQYIPTEDGIRFLTAYDYEVRFGAAGRLFDIAVFRPLIGWATAWSFDCLRLWIERGIEPERSVHRSIAAALAASGALLALGAAIVNPRRRQRMFVVSAVALSFLAVWSGRNLPAARHCLRKPLARAQREA